MTVQQTIPGAVVHDGITYLRNAQGDLTALANIKPMDRLMDEMVRKITGYAEDLSAELARFSAHTDADIAALDALIAQDYGVEPKETKGNRTFTSFDGLYQVKVAVSDRIVLGPELQAAKAVLDALIRERGTGVDPFLMTLIQRAFKVDQEGKVDVRAILALRRMQVDDPRWTDFCRAIDDSIRVVGAKRYHRIYRRPNHQAAWSMIPLDLAAVEPGPAAFERRSLRRQVEELEATRYDIAVQAARLSNLAGTNEPVAAVTWAVDYVVGDLAEIAEGRKVVVDTDPTLSFLAHMSLEGLSTELLLAHAKVLVKTAQRVLKAAAAALDPNEDQDPIDEAADAAEVLAEDIDAILRAE